MKRPAPPLLLLLLPLAACAVRTSTAGPPGSPLPTVAVTFPSDRPSAAAPSPVSDSTRTSAPAASLPPLGGALCHARAVAAGVLPDPACTPGATNPEVTQANIGSTICRAGYTTTIRPPTSYTSALKRQQIVAYGYPDTNPGDYEEDHLISLELGGAARDQRNLWPEPGHSPNSKDRVENVLHSRLCAGTLALAEAQRRIATDWTTATR